MESFRGSHGEMKGFHLCIPSFKGCDPMIYFFRSVVWTGLLRFFDNGQPRFTTVIR